MTGRIPARAARRIGTVLALGALTAIAPASAGAAGTPIYNNIPSPLPPNVVSQAFEATQTGEFGGQVEFAGPSLTKTTVTVGMSSWGCQEGNWFEATCKTEKGAKFSLPVTLHVYNVGTLNAVGTPVASVTKTFNMPFRPSDSPRCTGGRWFAKGQCYHGRLFKITFPLKGVALPSKAIISVSFNSSDYGAAPQGKSNPCNATLAGCPYDSLNIALTEPANEEAPEAVAPSVGTDPAPESAYHNSVTAGQYCDKGVGGTGTFRLDSGLPPCWTGYQPLFQVATS
ncbi:MAG TPA: hypothetical protein VGO14_10045 [Solirubrobacteraceae bacterium]|nr:hypothetical protein [Solirubrobacteraceae bacterium]